jgi:hypothetical protein
MNKFIITAISTCALVLFSSCSSDDLQNENNSNIQGVWKLAAWNVEGGFDMNNDGVNNTNLLNEIDCIQNETLLFEANGVVSLNTTFNPDIEIVLLNDATNAYLFNVECETEGVISLATSYTVNGSNVSIGESSAKIDGNQILIVFENSLEIYNEDSTKVVEARDLTLVYYKI